MTWKRSLKYPVKESNFSKMWNPPRHREPAQGPVKKQSMQWCFPGGKFHTVFGAQGGADTQGRMKSPCSLQVKTFIVSLMVHPKPELPSQCHSWELQLPRADASSTLGSLMQHLPLESSVSSTRDLSLTQDFEGQGEAPPLLEPSGKM